MNDQAPEPPLTDVERWLYEHAPPERLSSARAIYELQPHQSNRQLVHVYVPFNPRSEGHWSDAARIADYAARAPDGASNVLDIGPGDGWPSLPLAGARPDLTVTGVDPSPRRASVCATNARRLELPNARFAVGDAARLPFAGDSFDYVVAASSLEEVSEPETAFAELARVLRPGGALRASYQNWRLETDGFETVLLWGGRVRGERVLLFTYARRTQDPPVERRYTLVLLDEGEAARLHADALLTAAQAPRAYGETLLEGAWSALGVPLLRHLAPLARRSTVVEMRRWTTAWLVEALGRAGFAEVTATAHPGERARHAARELLASGEMEAAMPSAEQTAAEIGARAGAEPGEEMVLALR